MNYLNLPKKTALFGLLLLPALLGQAHAQKAPVSLPPTAKPFVFLLSQPVTQIDTPALGKLLRPKGKPLLVNFWATWCEPCREEFPDLVKINAEYGKKIDFITVSLDDLAEINRDVPKFLVDMKAEMPAFLLKTTDENAAISSVSPEWKGGLPFTMLFDRDGKTAYSRQGLLKLDVVRPLIERLIQADEPKSDVAQIINLELPKAEPMTFDQGVKKAHADFEKGQYTLLRYGLTPAIPEVELNRLKRIYDLTVSDSGCMVSAGYDDFVFGYNETMIGKLAGKFGRAVEIDVGFAPVRRK